MKNVYLIKQDGTSEAMSPVFTRDESKDLQNILKNNLDLLPGDQIEPDAPCRWMMIKREMPVPDPGTGSDRWNVDFLLVDQNAKPTFVECKRYLDTRARREVIGQVIEYVANARHYWSGEDLRAHADSTAKADGTTIEDMVDGLKSGFSVTDFFNEVEQHLRDGELRIVFFLEQAPDELKRSVEFLNGQMRTVDILIVEARQFIANGLKVVAPTLFGFTERIREIKRDRHSDGKRKVVAIDWESFEADARVRDSDNKVVTAIQELYDACKNLNADIAWGRGTTVGSFGPKWPSIHSGASLFSVFADGRLELHFSAFDKSEKALAFRAAVVGKLRATGFPLPDKWESGWPNLKPDAWVPKVGLIISALQDSVSASGANGLS